MKYKITLILIFLTLFFSGYYSYKYIQNIKKEKSLVFDMLLDEAEGNMSVFLMGIDTLNIENIRNRKEYITKNDTILSKIIVKKNNDTLYINSIVQSLKFKGLKRVVRSVVIVERDSLGNKRYRLKKIEN